MGIPLPALATQPPPDPAANIQRLIALKSLLGQQQIQQQQIQQGDLALEDQKTIRATAPKYVQKNSDGMPTGFDYDGFSADLAQQGVSAQTLNQIATMRKNSADALLANVNARKTSVETQDKLLTDAYNHLEGIRGETDPQKRQANWEAARNWAQQNIQGAQNLPLQAPDDKTLDGTEARLGMHAQSVADVKATSDAQKASADAALAQIKAKLATGAKPGDFDAQIDTIAPPTGPNAPLNARTKSMVNFALQRGDIDGATKAIDAASAQLGSIEKETNPQVQQGKVDVAAAEGRARANVEAQMARGSNAALANVPPHLITPATEAATKAGTEYAQAQSVTQRLQAMMDAAKNGNVVSYQLIPQEGALQLTTSQGVHRINMAEIQNYGGGSLWDRMAGHIGKQLTGKSIPDNVLNDMSEMQKIQAEGARSKYENTLQTINQNYGSNFRPVQMQGLQSAPPPGATMKVPGSDGKLHWSDGKRDLGVIQ